MPTTLQEREHINAFIDRDVRRELERLARVNERSLSAEIRLALRAHVERDETEENR
jgi:predicted transcriptional regulator